MNLIDALISQLNPCNIEGLSIEMKDFFLGDDFIESFKIEYSHDDRSYIISCVVSDLDSVKIKDIFMRFSIFIQYPKFTFYTRSKTNHEIEYFLISGSDDATCFCCRVTFRIELNGRY